MRCHPWLISAVILCCSGAATFARAEDVVAETGDPAADDAAYQRAVDLGLEEFKLGNFEEARSRFLEAHAVQPNARTLRALGKVEYELKHYLAAAAYFEEALASTKRPLTASMREEVQALRKKARGYVGTYTFALDPELASLRIDGRDLRSERTPPQVDLEVGEHVVEAYADGYETTRRSLRASGGEARVVKIRLLPVAQAAEAREMPLRRQWWLWTSVGAVVAGAVIAGVLVSQRDPSVQSAGGGSLGIVESIPDE